MIIIDLSYQTTIVNWEKISGGRRHRSYDNKAVASALSYAYGKQTNAVSGTSVYLSRGVSQAQSFSMAEASDRELLAA